MGLLMLLAFFQKSAYAEKPYLMAVLGDSVSAATFANTSVNLFSSLVPDSEDLFLYDNKSTLSWVSGKKIRSHFVYLSKVLGGRLAVVNNAVPGAKSQDVIDQAKRLLNEIKTGDYALLKYVTLMIGGNDACSTEEDGGTPNHTMETALLHVFWLLSQIKQPEKIRIFVPAIPKIPDLGRDEILNTTTLKHWSCRVIRDQIFKSCNPLIVWSDETEYKAHLKTVEEKNTVLQETVKKANQFFPNLDVYYSPRLFEAQVYPEYLAADCFHPNARGQQELSDQLWADQPWF